VNQKGIAYLYLLIIIASGFLLVKYMLSIYQSAHQPKSIITPQVSPQAAQKIKEATASDQMQQAKLEKYLTVEAALLGVSDNISLSFKDLDHGKEVNIEPTRQWIPASTIKAFVMVEAFRQRDLGLINFDHEVTINPSNVVPTELETDEFPRLREGTKVTIYQLIEAMIIQSDNTAYNTLLDILDRRNINLALKNIGITETVVGEKLNLDETQFQQDLQVAGRQSNTTTAKDLTTLFDLLYNRKIAHSAEILSIFKRQKINNMIPVFLPNNIVVAHKTGDWSSIYHDAGVVFKPDDPFVLSIMTNSGDPSIVAQIAKVAYFQTADSIGQTFQKNTPQADNQKNSNQIITLAKLPNDAEVLAEETPEKFPTITASDLGITPKDLNPNTKQISDVRQALITPGSIFYGIKKFFEDQQLKNAKSNGDQVTARLNLAKARLAEVKKLLGDGDIKEADKLLSESEDQLAKATELAKNDPDRDLKLIEIKHVNDLHFAVLADKSKSIPTSSKEQFVDTVYSFYQKNQKTVEPAIKASVIANPIQQKPAIGAVSEIKGNEATLKFDDGTTKQVILTPDTKVRQFQQDTYQSVDSIKPGDKIAVVGLTNQQSKVIPQFILKDVPKELPDKHTGTIIEIHPDEKTLKILDKKGQVQLIDILDKTTIKAKDTNVSLQGIKVGSQVTVFGSLSPSVSPIASLIPASSSTPNPRGSFSPSALPHPSNLPATTQTKQTEPQSIPNPPKNEVNKSPVIEIKATSITVTKNSSGAQEKVETKSPPKKEAPKKAPEPPKQPPSQPQPAKPAGAPKQESKSSDKK